MNKTIITVYGRAAEGKSDTIKRLCRQIISTWPAAKVTTHDKQAIDYTHDILLVIDIGITRIGIESQGDPNSRMIWADTILQLADRTTNPDLGGCDLIVCASRTEGMTVRKVDEVAQTFGYRTVWKSSYYTPDIRHDQINMICAMEILETMKLIMLGAL